MNNLDIEFDRFLNYSYQWGIYLFGNKDQSFEGYIFIDQGMFENHVIQFTLNFPKIQIKNTLSHKLIDKQTGEVDTSSFNKESLYKFMHDFKQIFYDLSLLDKDIASQFEYN